MVNSLVRLLLLLGVALGKCPAGRFGAGGDAMPGHLCAPCPPGYSCGGGMMQACAAGHTVEDAHDVLLWRGTPPLEYAEAGCTAFGSVFSDGEGSLRRV